MRAVQQLSILYNMHELSPKNNARGIQPLRTKKRSTTTFSLLLSFSSYFTTNLANSSCKLNWTRLKIQNETVTVRDNIHLFIEFQSNALPFHLFLFVCISCDTVSILINVEFYEHAYGTQSEAKQIKAKSRQLSLYVQMCDIFEMFFCVFCPTDSGYALWIKQIFIVVCAYAKNDKKPMNLCRNWISELCWMERNSFICEILLIISPQ